MQRELSRIFLQIQNIVVYLQSNTEYSRKTKEQRNERTVSDEANNTTCYEDVKVTTPVTDAIESVVLENPDAKIYSTSGVLVDEHYRGVVIINGKKFMKRK